MTGPLPAAVAKGRARPEDPRDAAPPVEDGADRDSLYMRLLNALERRVTVWESPKGRVVHASHCRTGPGGCRARIAVITRWLADAAEKYSIDPFVLAAMAVKESGLNPFAEGSVGELGLLQLHPRGVGRRTEFVRNERFRKRCERSVGACQQEVIEIGAEHLADAIARCGDLRAALGAYNSGKCGETEYTERILDERRELLERSAAPVQ